MKKLMVLTMPLAFLFTFSSNYPLKQYARSCSDSSPVIHTLDGNAIEWPAERFQKDEDTHISFAFDNDNENLYVAMVIPEITEQMKLMRMGMKMFIDLKAKKKENMGIEFPVKKDAASGGFTGGGRSESDQEGDRERRRPDPKQMRERMMLNLISMKLFGFEGQDEPKETGLTMFNTANLAFSWDSLDIMSIEYRIPLSMIAEPKSLENKLVSIGWKINGIEKPSGASGMPGGSTLGGGGRRSSAGRPAPASTPTGGTGGDRQQSFEKMSAEQTIWGKYTFILPPVTKAF